MDEQSRIEQTTDGSNLIHSLQGYATGPAILVVEDNTSVCEMLCWTLQLSGYYVTSCTSKQLLQWIDQALDTGRLPALVILDLSQPWIDYALRLRLLRMRWQGFPVTPPSILILTTIREIYDELASSEWVIQKPFHIQDLLRSVERVAPRSPNFWEKQKH